MKKILITGGSGFIGTNLINFLLKEKKFKIFNLDIFSYASTPDKFKEYYKNKNYFFIKGNIGNTSLVEKIIKKNNFEVIFNLAAYSHVDKSIDEPKTFIKNNILSNLNFIDLIYLCTKNNKFNGKFINISTDEVYGSNLKNPSNEESCLNPNSPYSASKASIDHIIRSYNKTFKLPYINVRCCNNFGPYQFSEKFIPTIITNIFANKKIPLYGDGKYFREWIYVEEFCSALYNIYLKGKINNIYNVGTNQRLSNFELAKTLQNIIKKKFKTEFNKDLIQYVIDRPGHDRSYKLNSNKIRKDTNWKNKEKLETSLLKTIMWYDENKTWFNYTRKKYDGRRQGLK